MLFGEEMRVEINIRRHPESIIVVITRSRGFRYDTTLMWKAEQPYLAFIL